jgi:hypothetical protein
MGLLLFIILYIKASNFSSAADEEIPTINFINLLLKLALFVFQKSRRCIHGSKLSTFYFANGFATLFWVRNQKKNQPQATHPIGCVARGWSCGCLTFNYF